jgi:HSP20 family protein
VSDEWWRRRRRFWDEFFSTEDIDKMFEDMERFFKELMKKLSEFTAEDLKDMAKELERRGARTYVYGFSITIGPDGKPIIREFGNVPRRRGEKEAAIIEEREPLVDVFERGDEIVVVAEMPGVEKDKVNVKVAEDGRTLIISGSDTDRRYYKEVDLPARVDPSSIKTTYKNGVLEVKLKKAERGPLGIKV